MRIGFGELIFLSIIAAIIYAIYRARSASQPSRLCPKCQYAVQPPANFCSNCGTVLRSVYPSTACPSCGRLGDAGSNFCRECGASMSKAL
jgi:RNA polymerase subunit RPABC4/transcription elongation factor Spt4